MQDLSTIFGFADLTMALLALVNLAALFLMLKVCFRLMRDYDDQARAGLTPVFDPSKFSDLKIDHEVWKDAAKTIKSK
jgi:alanine or glycine:cation symporter, AGCS family